MPSVHSLLLLVMCFWAIRISAPGVLCAEEASAKDAPAELVTVTAQSVVDYILSCRKPNGAFGPADQEYTDVAWNAAAVSAWGFVSDQSLEKPELVLEHGLGFPTGHAGVSHWHMFHQASLQSWLLPRKLERITPVKLLRQTGELQYYTSPLGPDQKPLYQLNATEFLQATQQAQALWYYNLSSLYLTLHSLELRQRKAENPEELVQFILRQQAPCGGFADVREDSALATDADARVSTTFQAVASLRFLNAEVPRSADCVRFLQSCQTKNGGFRAHPEHFPGNSEDVYYCWSAVLALWMLKSEPRDQEQCIGSINSLQNADGGFGDQPGWRSRLASTNYALHALDQLTSGGAAAAITRKQIPRPKKTVISARKFTIYQGLNKLPVCMPADLPGLAKRKLNLLALKSDKFPLAQALQETISADHLSMYAVLCLEAYPHRALRFGGIKLNHVANIMLDPRWTAEQQSKWQMANELGKQGLPWAEYQQQVLKPIQELGARVYPEQDFEMEHAYEAYDAGLQGLEGYQAVLAGFNWIPRDFVRVFPWRERYVDKLTPVADCDAHGDLAKWSPQLDYTRYLYLAEGPGYDQFLQAAEAKRVVCVIISPAGPAAGVTYYGPPAAVEYVKQRRAEWRWWEEE